MTGTKMKSNSFRYAPAAASAVCYRRTHAVSSFWVFKTTLVGYWFPLCVTSKGQLGPSIFCEHPSTIENSLVLVSWLIEVEDSV